MWTRLESIHITMQPTYTSKYFPAQGLVLAAGRVPLGHPWFGQLLASAFMCAAICWMLQPWDKPHRPFWVSYWLLYIWAFSVIG
jgi:hypothetical protein